MANFSHLHPPTNQYFFEKILTVTDLIFKEDSQTINIRKVMFLNINCLLVCSVIFLL